MHNHNTRGFRGQTSIQASTVL